MDSSKLPVEESAYKLNDDCREVKAKGYSQDCDLSSIKHKEMMNPCAKIVIEEDSEEVRVVNSLSDNASEECRVQEETQGSFNKKSISSITDFDDDDGCEPDPKNVKVDSECREDIKTKSKGGLQACELSSIKYKEIMSPSSKIVIDESSEEVRVVNCLSDNTSEEDHVQEDTQGSFNKKRCSSVANFDDEDGSEPDPKKAKFDDDEYSDNDFSYDITLNSSNFSIDISGTQKSYNNALEFDVLDEVDENANGDTSNNEFSDTDVSEDEIDALLDEGLTRPPRKDENDELAHEERKKVLLKVRGHNHFDVLPEGWIEVTHNSGMPVYLNKQSRVCTMSKPYFLGSGSARKHEVPISAIPCFHYKRELEKEEKGLQATVSSEIVASDQTKSPVVTTTNPGTSLSLPPAKVESVQESQKEHSIDYMGVREYCQKLFDFQTITVRRFRTWAGRRKHQKIMKQQQRPSLPDGTKLITCPLPPVPEKAKVGTGNVNIKREFIMNPCGKSFVCILHEYVQHAMRMQPKYIFKELENASTPYGAIVVINNMEYGSGFGSSKKQAKSEAARATLEILIPQLKDVSSEGKATQEQQQDVAFFDEVRIEDSRVNELCAKAGQPSPYQILLECLKRNYGMGDTQIQLKMQNLKHQKNMFTMTVGKHEASVLCKNKRDGKQRASQAILQALHPHITSWGSLLRLYGKGSCKTLKEKKEEEQRITELQSKACANRPNLSILNKLKEEMTKLKVRRDAVKPIGKFIPEEMELPSASASNLKNVEL